MRKGRVAPWLGGPWLDRSALGEARSCPSIETSCGRELEFGETQVDRKLWFPVTCAPGHMFLSVGKIWVWLAESGEEKVALNLRKEESGVDLWGEKGSSPLEDVYCPLPWGREELPFGVEREGWPLAARLSCGRKEVPLVERSSLRGGWELFASSSGGRKARHRWPTVLGCTRSVGPWPSCRQL